MIKNLPIMQETQVWSLGWEDPLEEEMTNHSSILAWRIPWTEEPGGLQSMELQRVEQDWETYTHTHTHTVDLQCCVTLRCTAQWFKHIFVSMYLFIPFHILSSYATAATAKSLQSCPTLCDPTDGSPPGSPIPGILQARTLEWVAISFSNAWKWEVKLKLLSRVWLLATPWTAATRLLCPWDFPGKSTGVGCHCLLQ